MSNSYRVKENIVHISMCAGALLSQEAIECDSSILTDSILYLAEKFEKKVVPTLKDGEYLEAIELFGNKELLERFTITHLFPIASTVHVNDGTSTHKFFINTDEVEVKTDENKCVTGMDLSCKSYIDSFVKRDGYDQVVKEFKCDDSVVTVVTKAII